ncbi:MAG TPA: pseudouridine-5'-phosphate glycosidase [Actinomycetota bacterium]|nr:pseudouridine-5'-phosphate glycosidase [Actinomycetota bacterium]
MTGPFRLSEEVRAALEEGRPVVALETSVLAQGLPAPRNLEAGAAMELAVRRGGAVPAWVAVEGGAVLVGATGEELARLASAGGAVKVARRDLPVAVASGLPGATTVSAALWAAHRVGIEVLATGGIGGVHPGTGDVSADLGELARTAGLVVCSGPKSIVDPVATAERLEELGVALVGYRCHRLPFFLVREAPVELEHRVETPEEAARVVAARRDLGVAAAVLLCNPIPEEAAMEAGTVAAAVEGCQREAERLGIRGKAVTPFLLACLAERTGGASLEANLALLEANAELAGRVARALAEG